MPINYQEAIIYYGRRAPSADSQRADGDRFAGIIAGWQNGFSGQAKDLIPQSIFM
jgi:hypothetical protein